jgi:hypothetical protein
LRKLIILIALLTACITVGTNAQNDDIILGQTSTRPSAAFFDLSNPMGVNIDVNVLGAVRLPGRYRIPIRTTFLDLLSFAGGPTSTSNLEDIRIYRQPKDTITGKMTVIRLNYQMIAEEEVKANKFQNPVLQSGDVIVLREEKQYTFRENISFILAITSSLIGITTLIVTLATR